MNTLFPQGPVPASGRPYARLPPSNETFSSGCCERERTGPDSRACWGGCLQLPPPCAELLLLPELQLPPPYSLFFKPRVDTWVWSITENVLEKKANIAVSSYIPRASGFMSTAFFSVFLSDLDLVPRVRDSIISITGRLRLLRGLSALFSSIAMLKGTLRKSTLAIISLTQWNTTTKKKSPFVGIILLFPGERCHFPLDYQDNCIIFSTLLCQWPKCYPELWLLCLVFCSSKLCFKCFFPLLPFLCYL